MVMRRVALGLLGLLAIALVVAQFAMPDITEDRIEDRLTEGGGSATASVGALPAVRLLVGDGDRIEVRGEGLSLDVEEERRVFERLDGFGEVDVQLDRFRAGPFQVERFDLRRDGDEPYRLVSSSVTSGGALVEYGSAITGLPGGSLLRALLQGSEVTETPVPVELDMELRSDGGRVRVVSGGGTVAGFPAGPLAQLLTAAVLTQL
jgi:hypothetical protein